MDISAGWCFGLARFDLTLAPGDAWQLHFDCPMQTYGNLHDELPGTATLRPEQYERRAQAHLDGWRERLATVGLQVPDDNFRNAFFANLQHMLTAMVGDQARIAPLAYPLTWLRDSVYIIRCLDLAGLHETAWAATEYCARNDFFGGFGAEGDGPGQGIWALVEHYRITRDRAWLARVYPDIRRKCEWLYRMRRAEKPIRVTVDTPVLPYTLAERTSGVICDAAQEGIIRGSMDHRIDYSIGWINHWALAGLREAAYAAQELGLVGEATAYAAEEEALREALAAYAQRHPDFFDLQRTVNSLLWSSRAWKTRPSASPAALTAGGRRTGARWSILSRNPSGSTSSLPRPTMRSCWGSENGPGRWCNIVCSIRMCPASMVGAKGARVAACAMPRRASRSSRICAAAKSLSALPRTVGRSRRCGSCSGRCWRKNGRASCCSLPACRKSGSSPMRASPCANFPTWYGHITAELQVDATAVWATVTVSGAAKGTPIRVRLPAGDTLLTADGTVSAQAAL